METSGTTAHRGAFAPDLDDLSALVGHRGPFLSVYLTTEQSIDNAAQRSEQRWKASRAQLADGGAPEAALAAVDPVIADAHLHGGCLAAFATEAGLLHVEHGDELRGGDVLRWDTLPVLAPVIEWRQSSPPYVLVLADRRGADLFAYRRARADIEVQAGGSDDPIRKSSPGGWSQRRYQDRAENTWEHNAHDVADKVATLVDRIDARLVVIAGDMRARQLIEDALPVPVRELVRDVAGGRAEDGTDGADEDQLRRAVQTVIAEDTVALLEKYKEEAGQHDRAAGGIRATIQALNQAQVDTLLLHDHHRSGELDERRGWFGSEPVPVALASGELDGLGVDQPREGRLADVLIAAALGTAASVRIMPAAGPVPDGVGAVLRWGG